MLGFRILSLKPLLHIRTITQNCTRQYLGWVVGDYGTWFKDPLLRYFLDDKLVGVQELVTGRQGAAAGSQGSALPPVAAAASNCSPRILPSFTIIVLIRSLCWVFDQETFVNTPTEAFYVTFANAKVKVGHSGSLLTTTEHQKQLKSHWKSPRRNEPTCRPLLFC